MTVDFLLVSNDNYVKYLGICTYSVMYNMCPVAEKVRIFVMDCGITEKNREKLLRQAAKFRNAELLFFDITGELNRIAPKIPTNWNRAIYGRLFLDAAVREYGVKRLVYLDCDLLMNRPVTVLFTLPLDGKCLAGVADGEGLRRMKALGIDLCHTYINSGVLVIDTQRWTELDASARIVEFINGFQDRLVYPDQDAINYVMQDEIKVIEPRYNMLWMICERDIPKMLKYCDNYIYNEEQTRVALYNGSVYHFAGHDMWRISGLTPVHDFIFRKYYRMCDWKNEKRYFTGFMDFALWFLVSFKRLLIGELTLTRREMKHYF